METPDLPSPALAETKRRALGRGLESLLPARPAREPDKAADAPSGKPLDLDLDLIDRNPFQTRSSFDESKLDELASSIAASGVVQPIIVRSGRNHRYTLIAGERRLLASRKAGKTTIPAVLREVSDLQAMEMTVVENLQRADLNPMEQAHAYQRLSREFHLTQEQMAERTGKDRASVANFLRLLKLPDGVQAQVAEGALSFGHARALLALPSEAAIVSAAQKVMALHLSVRGTESMVQALLNPETGDKSPEKPKSPVDPNVREAEARLRRALGLRVSIQDKRGKGKVIIEYTGVEDFDGILRALGQQD